MNSEKRFVNSGCAVGSFVRGRLEDHERGLALVVDLRDVRGGLELRLDGQRAVDDHLLLAVQEHRELNCMPGTLLMPPSSRTRGSPRSSAAP
jgi:hypothetical protein